MIHLKSIYQFAVLSSRYYKLVTIVRFIEVLIGNINVLIEHPIPLKYLEVGHFFFQFPHHLFFVNTLHFHIFLNHTQPSIFSF